MSITIQLNDTEAALVLRLLDAELTQPQILIHQAMNPHEDLQEYRAMVARLIERFHATVR
jgi:hypothetical protein